MRFDTKIAVVVRDDLASWQKLNVTAFLSSGIAHCADEIVGKPYADGSGNDYLPMFREPVLVYAADAPALSRTRTRALTRGVATALYPMELFATDNDDDNRAAVLAIRAEDLDLAGIAVRGPRAAVDKVIRGLRLHG
ncbi:DUF2000 family protein [Streptomyces zagrosensis]|uniref:DUF2000 domain-containing protein n=1 Tax=Streptomyces zagrosensis TaxID=1042984 RepID=A0A7W9UWE2_9ACTN|nr:DUF2000 family protein [Streptomyces zagrosensis]MBB5933226.1 hypothetical protein [Streptomyces zagrosensis]